MQSGNVYRFRADGSAIEQFAWGQVNPFGLCFDPLGNLYTADCHSRPVTMVLREGYYPSFGKPHDGLGFAPETTDIDHGGTGIAGVVYYAADQFPAEFQGAVRRQRHHQPRPLRPAQVERFVAATCRRRRFSDLRRSLVPAGRHSTRARTAHSTSPISTTASSATTKSRSPIPAATASGGGSGASSIAAPRPPASRPPAGRQPGPRRSGHARRPAVDRTAGPPESDRADTGDQHA